MDTPPKDKLLNCLSEKFRFFDFRDQQRKIILSIIENKRDNFWIAPTGHGKSLCYQFPSVYLNTITIVITPFIQLMQEQVKELQAKGIEACFLGSAQRNTSIIEGEIIENKYRIVYMTPEYAEKWNTYIILDKIQDNLTLFAIDCGHYISKWGNGFRKSYGELRKLRKLFPSVPILAMTAAVTPECQDYIINILELNDPQVIITGICRPNLELIVKEKTDLWSDVGPYIEDVKNGSIIIYCNCVDDTEALCTELKKRNIKCAFYHGTRKMNIETRDSNAEDFFNNKIQVIIATVAYGMGLNMPINPLIIHYDMPIYLETYYHQVGIAGRDGSPGKCVMFYNIEEDWKKIEYLLRECDRLNVEQCIEIKDTMCDYIQTLKCRHCFILSYFGTGNCENCRVEDDKKTIEKIESTE